MPCAFLSRPATEFFSNLVLRAIRERDADPPREKLHDVLELMMAARNTGSSGAGRKSTVNDTRIARTMLQVC